MDYRDRRRYEMLIRLRNFGAAYGQLFPDTSTAHATFEAIGAEIALLETLDTAERSASRAARVTRQAAARGALANSLTRAGSTARVLAIIDPTVTVHVDVPQSADDAQLLMLARDFVAAAAPSATQFAAHGIPISEVEGRINALQQALQERGTGRDSRVKARAEIEASFSRAMVAVAVLDVTVANCLAADPVALAVWKQDRQLKYRPRSSKADEPAAPNPPTEPAGQPAPNTSAPPAAAA